VAISAYVQEFSGDLVKRAGSDINALCAFVNQNATAYPLLRGIDPYDDTCFNRLQAVSLADELKAIAQHAPEPVSAVAQELLSLTALLEAAPNRPGHRRLVFSGD
jgi:hypothetical protein